MSDRHVLNIRSVTGFISLADPLPSLPFGKLGELIQAARADLSQLGFPVQTTRLATQPIAEIAPSDLSRFARELEAACRAIGIEYASMGAVRADHRLAPLELLEEIPAALAGTENIFAAVQIASFESGINLAAVSATARLIRALADRVPDGFGNFRFAALANCPPHSPFFPAAYHSGGPPAFSIGVEGAPLAVEAFTAARNLDEARARMVAGIERAARALVPAAEQLAAQFGITFSGIDFSLAPFPEDSASIGAAIERLTGARFGEHGTLFAVGFITDCIQRAEFPRVGFSGVFLPVLEDTTLAARSELYDLGSLLLYSSVCGTGLDTIPLPGDTSADAIAAILLDLSTLALRLNKPLTARLIPLPGLQKGEMTRFDFKYFANARVLDPNGRALKFFDTDSHVQFNRGSPRASTAT